MLRRAVRLVTYAWGKSHIDKLLDFTLASVLSPRDLPLLAEVCDRTLVVVTEEAWFDYIRAHTLVKRLEQVCALRLISLDDLVAESWQYGITLAHALVRGFAELGHAVTETYMLFLNADFVLADGSYERLIPHMEAGRRAILAPSYCAVEERVRPALRARAARNDGLIILPPREMAALILANRHNTIRAKTVNQDLFHFKYMDQFCWAFDEETLLAHQILGWSRRQRRSRIFGMAARLTGGPLSMALALVANLFGQSRDDGPVPDCTAVRIEIDVERTPELGPETTAPLDPAASEAAAIRPPSATPQLRGPSLLRSLCLARVVGVCCTRGRVRRVLGRVNLHLASASRKIDSLWIG
jgi:hypothetical protein